MEEWMRWTDDERMKGGSQEWENGWRGEEEIEWKNRWDGVGKRE
jgi:hypothetical protein